MNLLEWTWHWQENTTSVKVGYKQSDTMRQMGKLLFIEHIKFF
jgi:hypothetical protein